VWSCGRVANATATETAMSALQRLNLVLATWVSIVNFWAWNMIGPLATSYAEQMSLSSVEVSALVATPILVGSLGRIAVGSMADRFGGRAMFIAVCLGSSVSVSVVGIAATMRSYPLLLVFGFFLGMAGTVFAVGIPFTNNLFDPDRRGFAIGVFGMGMIGVGCSAFFTPRLVRWIGLLGTHLMITLALVLTAVLCRTLMRDGPRFTPNTAPVLPQLMSTAKLAVTWQLSFLHAVIFGGFVAFGIYLPIYLMTIYGFSPVAAGIRTAGFVLAGTIARPAGGWLSDRIAPKYVVLAALAGDAVLTFAAVFQPPVDVWAGVTFILLAVCLGIGTGGLSAWVARNAPAPFLGSVNGIVAAAAGMGGYFPLFVLGATYDRVHNDYTIGLMLLAATAAASFAYTALRLPAGHPAAGRTAKDPEPA
jgi:MFS transporter, NNP family, nitrate/nitrite transporter